MGGNPHNDVQFDMIDYEKCVGIWDKQWERICHALEGSETLPKFEELIEDDVFCHVISQIMAYPEAYTTYSSEIVRLFRGVNEKDETKVCLERFIPQWKYVDPKSPNRMNGPDKLYSYFTIEYGGCAGDDLYYTSAHEIRLPSDSCFWGCEFKFDEGKKLRFVDLRTKERIPKDSERCFRFLKSKATHGNRFGKIDKSEVEKWVVQVVFSIWEDSDMFAPIDKSKDDLWLQYRPFHLLCDFFERTGFDGVIYRSTVYKKGACLALFNIDNAIGIPKTITHLDEEKYRNRK